MIDFLKNRKVQIAAQAVVITGLVGGTGAVLTMNKPVTLEVNGKAEEIRTFGGTVGEILDSQNIELEKRDEVKPGVNTKIDRDMTVTVNTAKDVALTVDGKKTDEWTNANTVGQALADLGVEAKDAELSAEANDKLKVDGETSIDVTTAKALTVVADGKDHKVTAPVDTHWPARSATPRRAKCSSRKRTAPNGPSSIAAAVAWPATSPLILSATGQALRSTSRQFSTV